MKELNEMTSLELIELQKKVNDEISKREEQDFNDLKAKLRAVLIDIKKKFPYTEWYFDTFCEQCGDYSSFDVFNVNIEEIIEKLKRY